jgi:hypothetical protein
VIHGASPFRKVRSGITTGIATSVALRSLVDAKFMNKLLQQCCSALATRSRRALTKRLTPVGKACSGRGRILDKVGETRHRARMVTNEK